MAGRTPRSWYWEEKRGWYVTLDRRRRCLARGPKRETKAEAAKELRRLLTERDQQAAQKALFPGQPATTPARLVGEVFARYAANLESRTARKDVSAYALPDFLRRTEGFVEATGDLAVADLKPFHIEAWLDTKTKLGPTSRHDAVNAVKAATKWALEQGLIDRDPLTAMKRPRARERREKVIDARLIPNALELIPAGPFRDLMAFLHLTGCRPSEAARLEAKDIDPARSIAVLTQHKTDKKTSRPRVIPLSPEALELLQRLAKEHPTGPLFLNAHGKPWHRWAINDGIKRLRKKTGLGNELTAYAIRHGMATDLVANGVSSAVAAEILGHSDTRMIDRVYAHLDQRQDVLHEAVKKVRKPKGEPQ